MIYSSELDIPQIKNDHISARDFFKDYGFHIERNHFEKKICTNIISHFCSSTNYKSHNYKPEMMSHNKVNLVNDLMKNKELVNFVNLYIGDNINEIFGLQNTFFYGPPGTQGFPMHQDSFYNEPSDSWGFCSAWIPLVDIEEDMGNLIVYKNSHLKGKLPVRKLNLAKDPNQDPNFNNEEAIIESNKYDKIYIREKMGSIVFLHGDLVHSSIKNKTNKYRFVQLISYIRGNCTFRAGHTAKRKFIDLKQ